MNCYRFLLTCNFKFFLYYPQSLKICLAKGYDLMMILGQMSYLDCIVFLICLAPQLLMHVNIFELVFCVFKALPFFCKNPSLGFLIDAERFYSLSTSIQFHTGTLPHTKKAWISFCQASFTLSRFRYQMRTLCIRPIPGKHRSCLLLSACGSTILSISYATARLHTITH